MQYYVIELVQIGTFQPIEDLAVRTECILIPLRGGREDSMVSKVQFTLSVCYCLLYKATFFYVLCVEI